MVAERFSAGTSDVDDGNLNLNPAPFNQNGPPQPFSGGSSFSNQPIPAGFAPYNIQNINGTLFVTYAQQNAQKNASVGGAGNGYVAMFNFGGNLFTNLIAQGPLNSPWGIAIAPPNFGPFAGALIVGNFSDGKINAFNATTGAFLGTLNDTTGKPIAIPGLWSLNFGSGADSEDPGTLYVTAGIGGGADHDSGETHRLLPNIQAAPPFPTSGLPNARGLIRRPDRPHTRP